MTMGETWPGSGDMLEVALQGFSEAHHRHNDLRLTAEPRKLYVSAAECVYWASVIDEQLRGTRGYLAFTARHNVGVLLPGVHYVRNLKTHALPVTMRSIPGKVFPIIYPVIYAEVVWLPLDQLPQPTKRNKHTPAQAASYADQMAGAPTRHTFQRLAQAFTELKAMR